MTKIVGITGGIASGKSEVSDELAHRGAAVISADKIAGEVLDFPQVQNEICRLWGNSLLERTPAGKKINRKLLASFVFVSGDSEQITLLNRITHPRILERVKSELARLSQTSEIIVLDAPLLYETGLDKLCDSIIFVDTEFSIRAKRAALRGWSADELCRREALQVPTDEKKSRADFILVNNDSFEKISEQIDQFFTIR